jgi:hypothetical protein
MYCHGDPINYSDPSGYREGDITFGYSLSKVGKDPGEQAQISKGEVIITAAAMATIGTAASGGTGSPAVVTFTLNVLRNGTLTISAKEVIAVGGALVGSILLHHQNNNTVMFSKGGKQNVKHEDFKDKSPEWLEREYKKLKGRLTPEEKQYKAQLKKEMKGIKRYNKQKRDSD